MEARRRLTGLILLAVFAAAGTGIALRNAIPPTSQQTIVVTMSSESLVSTCDIAPCETASGAVTVHSTRSFDTGRVTVTTLESIAGSSFLSGKDKAGSGGVTVTVEGLRVVRVTTEADGDWHVALTDGKQFTGKVTFIAEITPPYQAAEGKPHFESVIDVTGVPYCDTHHADEAWHGYTCWEIHPVTAWHLHS